MQKETGKLSINTDNLLPIIKRWLYSDRDIFMRELISNASDAITKMKKLVELGEAEGEGRVKERRGRGEERKGERRRGEERRERRRRYDKLALVIRKRLAEEHGREIGKRRGSRTSQWGKGRRRGRGG
jgi:hypothetical protein